MFADRFDALMNIAEVSNSLLGRAVNINSSHIGRLRSGARPLPKKHTFLPSMCLYLCEHMQKDYQQTALQKLTGIGSGALRSREETAEFLEHWLVDSDQNTATGRISSGVSKPVPRAAAFPDGTADMEMPQKLASCLYGNAGKRKAVEQFFQMILQEEAPQTLLLSSDETMEWLFEDAAFTQRWRELFTRVLMKGNRVRIIHALSRDMNEMMESLAKWIPIYMTGMMEPYCYPRLRDGVLQRTLFIAPKTAAVVSSSVMKATEGMLNFFTTDKAAIAALSLEFENYFSLCRPLMQIYSQKDASDFMQATTRLIATKGAACIYSSTPPLFALSEKMVKDLEKETGNDALYPLWERARNTFKRDIQKQPMNLILLDARTALASPQDLHPPMAELLNLHKLSYTPEQYLAQLETLNQLAEQYENLHISYRPHSPHNLFLYVKEDAGVIMANASGPVSAFVISDNNLTTAFWDYLLHL